VIVGAARIIFIHRYFRTLDNRRITTPQRIKQRHLF